jgi:hypothetical protein
MHERGSDGLDINLLLREGNLVLQNKIFIITFGSIMKSLSNKGKTHVLDTREHGFLVLTIR